MLLLYIYTVVFFFSYGSHSMYEKKFDNLQKQAIVMPSASFSGGTLSVTTEF